MPFPLISHFYNDERMISTSPQLMIPQVNSCNDSFNSNHINLKTTTLEDVKNKSTILSEDLKHNSKFKKTSSKSREMFKKEDDEKIIQLVKIYGTHNWSIIASFIPFKHLNNAEIDIQIILSLDIQNVNGQKKKMNY